MNNFQSHNLIDEELINTCFLIIEDGYSIRAILSLLRNEGIVTNKSSLHMQLHKRIPKIDKQLYNKLVIALNDNFSHKHIRSGVSTKQRKMKAKKAF